MTARVACPTEGCDQTARVGHVCTRCRARQYYWRPANKTVADVLERARKLTMYRATITAVIDGSPNRFSRHKGANGAKRVRMGRQQSQREVIRHAHG